MLVTKKHVLIISNSFLNWNIQQTNQLSIITTVFMLSPFNYASPNAKSFQTKHSEIYQNSKRTNEKYTKSLKSSRFDENPLNVDFIIEFEERMTRRQNRLEGFLINCDDENSYEHFINLFISFEEGLVQN